MLAIIASERKVAHDGMVVGPHLPSPLLCMIAAATVIQRRRVVMDCFGLAAFSEVGFGLGSDWAM